MGSSADLSANDILVNVRVELFRVHGRIRLPVLNFRREGDVHFALRRRLRFHLEVFGRKRSSGIGEFPWLTDGWFLMASVFSENRPARVSP